MAEITKINIKGVDYDIGGTGGGGLKIVEVSEVGLNNSSATITEERFNEIFNADIVIWNNDGASALLYKNTWVVLPNGNSIAMFSNIVYYNDVKAEYDYFGITNINGSYSMNFDRYYLDMRKAE